jgi:nucleotide-binding universal stress UspA family protein
MFKKILVPTDASEYSVRAFKTAVDMARCFQAEIVLIHVTFPPQGLVGYAPTYEFMVSQEELISSGQAALDATLSGTSTEGVAISKVLEIGYPAVKVLEQIKKDNIDFVVMGSHGYGPLTGSVLGSVSQRVLQKSPVPVLLIK